MWQGAHWTGGLYQWHGNDSDLTNDRFENADRQMVVAGNVSAYRNNGYRCSGCDTVVTYTGTYYTGQLRCIYRGQSGTLGMSSENFQYRSYHWGGC
jgi:hypothetical protein